MSEHRRMNVLDFLAKYWSIITAVFIVTMWCITVGNKVEAHDVRIVKIEEKCDSISEIKTDIKWIREVLKKDYRSSHERVLE